MKQYQRKIEEYKSLIQKEYIRETAVHTVKERCSDIMNRQDNRRASYFEFLFEQFKFIKKRWWVLQGGILILLWILLVDSDGGANTERTLGAMSVMFSVMIIPEIWKNRSFSAVEIEKTAFYSLRQICAARILLFGGKRFRQRLFLGGEESAVFPENKGTVTVLAEKALLRFRHLGSTAWTLTDHLAPGGEQDFHAGDGFVGLHQLM